MEANQTSTAAEALAIARTVAGEAAVLLRNAAGSVDRVRSKTNSHDLVTEWDMRCEELICTRLGVLTPEIPVLAEESATSGQQDHAGDYQWHVDPIDGTVNFFHGLPYFAVVIGLEHRGQPIAGAIYAPALSWQFYGHLGGGAFMNGDRLRVSQVASLDQAMLVTGFPYDRADHPDNNLAQWDHFQRRVQACRRLGAAALDLCMVARGWIDGYWEGRLNSWDVSAGALLVREAGGVVTSLGGEPFVSTRGEVVAANAALNRQIVAELATISDDSVPI